MLMEDEVEETVDMIDLVSASLLRFGIQFLRLFQTPVLDSFRDGSFEVGQMAGVFKDKNERPLFALVALFWL